MKQPFRHKKAYLYITVFFSGMTALAVEFLASRLLGNVFGTSNIVWASIIGLILIYLSLGYWLGGKLADRSPFEKTLFKILSWAGFSVGLIPIVSRPILRLSANAFDLLQIPILFGSFTVVLILFSIPVTLLGMASPFAIKLLLKDSNKVGVTSGQISALSTVGSFLGTFITVLVLIPLIGTYRTFIIFSLVMLFIAFVGLIIFEGRKAILPYFWMPIIILLLLIFGIRGADKSSEGLIYETESAYNYIQVLENDGYRFLRLNEGQGMHSIYHPDILNYGGPWSQVLVAPFFNDAPQSLDKVERIAILGLAAGTTARQASFVYPNTIIDGYEIDPKIIQVGNEFFEMDLPMLNIFTEDARWGISHSHYIYDIISVDAYRPPYIPPHMTTIEFFEIVYSQLSDEGVMVINVGRSPQNRELVDDLTTTIGKIFPKIFIVDIPESFNSMIFATKSQSTSWDNFIKNREILVTSGVPDLLIEAMDISIAGIAQEGQTGRTFTDDLSPIEWITNKIVLDFVFSPQIGFEQ